VRAAWPGVSMAWAEWPPEAIEGDNEAILTVDAHLNGLSPDDVVMECLLTPEMAHDAAERVYRFSAGIRGIRIPSLRSGHTCARERTLPDAGADVPLQSLSAASPGDGLYALGVIGLARPLIARACRRRGAIPSDGAPGWSLPLPVIAGGPGVFMRASLPKAIRSCAGTTASCATELSAVWISGQGIGSEGMAR